MTYFWKLGLASLGICGWLLLGSAHCQTASNPKPAEGSATNIVGYVYSTTSFVIPTGVWLPVVAQDFLGYTVITQGRMVVVPGNQVQFLTVDKYHEMLEAKKKAQLQDAAASTSAATGSKQPGHFDSLTTLSGSTYHDVTVAHVLPDAIQIRHSSGVGKIAVDDLSDETLAALNLPTKAMREVAQKRAEKELQDKLKEAQEKAAKQAKPDKDKADKTNGKQ